MFCPSRLEADLLPGIWYMLPGLWSSCSRDIFISRRYPSVGDRGRHDSRQASQQVSINQTGKYQLARDDMRHNIQVEMARGVNPIVCRIENSIPMNCLHAYNPSNPSCPSVCLSGEFFSLTAHCILRQSWYSWSRDAFWITLFRVVTNSI